MKSVLVIGGTGAMGIYLIPELLKRGYAVDVLSLDTVESNHPNLRYFTGNATDMEFVKPFLEKGYDGIVDFMIYHRDRFAEWYPVLLAHTGHYIYLSSYRVYADEEHPIRETSPRLLDASKDQALLASEDYSIYKAQGEEMLKASSYRNWTIIRPAITYSSRRFQLVTLEMNQTVGRACLGKKVVLPKTAKDVQATMTWAGDVAAMIATILFNKQAIGEVYTVSTAEHHTWGEVAEYYRELIGMEVVWADEADYLAIVNGGEGAWRQLHYDRLFDRIVDNGKILALMGKTQSDLKPLYEGLKKEIDALPKDLFATLETRSVDTRMDAWIAEHT